MRGIVVLLSFVVAGSAFATEYRAKPVTLKGEITATTASSTQVLEALVPIYRVDTVWVPQQTTCSRVECADGPGNGSTGDWHNFFNVPRAERPAALAAAIKGIGEKTAVRILDAGYFRSKPDNWSAFSREINNAQVTLSSQGYQGQFADAVLNQYGQENAKNLGYYVETSCHTVTYSCTVVSEQERETFAYNLDRKVTVSTRGAVLQDFETDTYSVRVGFEPQAIEVSSDNYYNKYDVRMTQVTQRDSRIEMVAMRRNLVTFPAEAGSGSLSPAANGLEFSGSFSPQYLPSGSDANSRVVVRYKVCKTDLFSGCGKTEINWTDAPITGTRFSVVIPGSVLNSGKKHKVWYKFIRIGSKYYSGEGVEQKTSPVKF